MAIGFTIDNSNPFNAIFLPLANKFAENLQNQGVKVFNDTPISNNKNSRIIFGLTQILLFGYTIKKITIFLLIVSQFSIKNGKKLMLLICRC